MQDPEFEKQVHQKMEEMQLLPSEDVWTRVERRLHAKRRSRRWTIFFPSLFLALSIGASLLYNVISSSSEKQTPAIAGLLKDKQHNTNLNKKADAYPTRKKEEATSASIDVVAKNKHIRVGPGAIQPDSSARSDHQSAKNHSLALKSSAGPAKKRLYQSNQTNRNERLQTDEDKFLHESENPLVNSKHATHYRQDAEPGQVIAPEKSIAVDSANSEVPENLLPAIIQSLRVPDSLINTLKSLDSLRFAKGSPMRMKQGKLKIEWGLVFQGGRSGVTNGSISELFANSSVADLNNSFRLNNPSVVNPSGVYTPPSVLKAGRGFTAGAYIKKQLSRRVSVSAGLQYARASTTHKVGKRVDSSLVLPQANSTERKAIEEFYSTGSTANYVNKYHFIELPVLIETRLTGNRFLPVYWDLGFSVSRLITSNALHYDGNSRIYYKDNSVLQHTQFSLITGLPVRIITGDQFSLKFGPQAQYGLSNLINREKTGGKHLLFVGLKADIQLFNK